MNNSFPKDITDCMRDCILAIFWPRKDIIAFLENNACTKKDLENVVNFEETELTRVGIIEIVFENLRSRYDHGIGQFRSMLKSLINWTYFDPYYFKELKKLDEDEARERINHLKQLQEIRDAKKRNNIEARRKREKEIQESQITQDEIQKELFNLYQGKDHAGNEISFQKRGYALEDVLRKICLREKIAVTEQFRTIGEQIDGALKYDGENYILEAKWHDKSVASDSLYHFAYKIEGKMYGRGIFISINGYTRESVLALITGKALKTILFDGEDLTLIAEGFWSFTNMLDVKIKAAQTMGKIYIRADTMQDKIKLL